MQVATDTPWTPEALAKASFKYFFIRVLGYTWVPHYAEWQELIEHNQRFLLMCARGHGKTIFLISYSLWLVYRGWPVDILFMSHSEEQVRLNIMNKIDEIIMKNDYLVHLRPGSKQLWGAQLKTFANGSLIRGESFGSGIRGAHPDYVFEDDPLKDKGGMTPEEQYNYHMTAISGMAKKNTVIGVIGTPLDNGDLLEQLEHNKAYTFKSYPALDDNGNALFPFLFDKETLRKKEEEIGSFAFSREYLLKRIDAKTQVFKDTYRTVNNDLEFPEHTAVRRTLIDPAISEKDAACDSAIVTVDVSEKNQIYEKDTRFIHSDDPARLVKDIIRVAQIFKNHPDYAIVIESEVFQKVFEFNLRHALNEANLDITVIPVTHTGIQGKHQRIMGLQPAWEARSIHLLPESPLISQFRYYRPNIRGFKIDGIDAFSWIKSMDVCQPITNAEVVNPGCEQAWEDLG